MRIVVDDITPKDAPKIRGVALSVVTVRVYKEQLHHDVYVNALQLADAVDIDFQRVEDFLTQNQILALEEYDVTLAYVVPLAKAIDFVKEDENGKDREELLNYLTSLL